MEPDNPHTETGLRRSVFAALSVLCGGLIVGPIALPLATGEFSPVVFASSDGRLMLVFHLCGVVVFALLLFKQSKAIGKPHLLRRPAIAMLVISGLSVLFSGAGGLGFIFLVAYTFIGIPLVMAIWLICTVLGITAVNKAEGAI